MPARKGALRGMIANATTLGDAAYEEPRYWRAPWPTPTFDRAIDALSTLRFTMASLEAGVTQAQPNGEAKKEEHFLEVLKMDSFDVVRNLLSARFDDTKASLEKSLTNETGASLMSFSQSQMLSSDLGEKNSAAMTALDAFVADFNKQKHRGLPKDGTLEDDPVADISILVCSLQAIFAELEAVNEILVS